MEGEPVKPIHPVSEPVKLIHPAGESVEPAGSFIHSEFFKKH
jgi:hypothetical protein